MAQQLIDAQHNLHGLIARAMVNFQKLSTNKKSKESLESRLENLERNWSKFEENHYDLLATYPEAVKETEYIKSDFYQVCEEDYLQTKSEFRELLRSFDQETHNRPRRDSRNEVTRSRALPKIDLPKFSGKFQDWISFKDLFLSLVGNSDNISDVEKMHYLKVNVLGDASKLIASIPISEENYERAWAKLEARYDNKRALINAQLDLLFSLKPVQRKCARDLETLRATVAEVVEALGALGAQVEHWDYILVYFVCRRLDPESQEAWELTLGGSANIPKYEELNTFLESRIRALENVQSTSNPRAAPAMASISNPRSAPPMTSSRPSTSRAYFASSASCAYCQGNHFISSCATYQEKSPVERREIAISSKLCFNCLGSHRFVACRSTKRCIECRQKHHTSLHSAMLVEAHTQPGTARIHLGTTHAQLSAPQAQLSAPHAQLSAPQAQLSAPQAQLSAPQAQLSAPHAQLSAPHAQLSAPHAQLSAPQAQLSAPHAQLGAPHALPRNSHGQVARFHTSENSGTSSALHAAVTSSAPPPSQSLLATALVTIVSPNGNQVRARALLDQGSELTFICESLVQALQLPRRQCEVSLFGIGAQRHATTRGLVLLRFQNFSNSFVEFTVEAHVLPRLTGKIPAVPLDTRTWTHLDGLNLADPNFAVPGPIDVLFGANIYAHLLEEDIRKSTVSEPVAQRTALGWVVSGPTTAAQSQVPTRSFSCTVDFELHELVKSFWAQEEVPCVERGRMSKEEAACEQHFQSTHTRDQTGRYIVKLPFKEEPPEFGDSRGIAHRMLRHMHGRFERDQNLYELYVKFMEEYAELKHMEPVGECRETNPFFLPHHGVLRSSSTTTKLRVVFNGSQKTEKGISLNEFLLSGPKMQTDLVNILLRWRCHQFVFTADVEKMYRQIVLHPSDRPYQRILWSSTPRPPFDVYQLCTLTYGLTCSPFLALRVLRQLADDEKHRFPLAEDIVKTQFYVDDLMSGSDTVESAREKARQVDLMLLAGGFRLQKWASNEDRVIAAIEEDRRAAMSKVFEEGPVLRALGLSWNPVSDSFVFTLQEEAMSVASPTKRSVLSVVAKLYDPLGWLAPVTIIAKIFLQTLWKTDLQWDDALPDTLVREWQRFTQELGAAISFAIPRWVRTTSTASIQLHGFADASKDALAAVIFTRSTTAGGTTVSLLTSKTRVAPLKPVTIARLELAAAVLLARLVDGCRSALTLPKVEVHLWTDSAVALAWITAQASQWKDYVANRVNSIQELVPDAVWHHVPGVENPADVASRGMYPRQLVDFTLWWKGPNWLTQDPSSWPSSSAPSVPEDVNMEERRCVVHVAVAQDKSEDLTQRYSSLDRLLRVTARVFQAIARFRRSGDGGSSLVLKPEEREKALTFWVRQVQREHFQPEIETLEKGEKLSKSNPLIKLSPFLDKNSLLRVGGRLKNAALEYDVQHPLIIPKKAHLSELLIADAHARTLHGGTQITLVTLRQRYWIVGGRIPVRSYILRCTTCARQRAATAQQMMGQLPSFRTTPSRPFLHAGVDYAGPFMVKTWTGRSAKTLKAYLVIFVCFATSAVHLELSSDYTTQGFLGAYKRFAGRRGVCATIVSDQGTNLVGADAELRRMFSEASKEFADLRNLLASDNTQWRFNPPSAPHFGGKWEAAVKSTKFHLKRILGNALLTFEEFSCLLAQIESILNSRPLCPLSDDPSDMTALTPGHFLTGGPLNLIPEPSLIYVAESRLSRWQKVRQMVEHFWARWSIEYLQRFLAVSKWHHPRNEIKVGSLVLIADERYPPSKWPLARVTAVHPGQDGLVRVATVRTASGSHFQRPIVKLCILPVEQS